MKPWLKGGLIGGIVGLIFCLVAFWWGSMTSVVLILPALIVRNLIIGEIEYIFMSFSTSIFIINIIIWFVIGSVIGWMIGKIKARNQNITQ